MPPRTLLSSEQRTRLFAIPSDSVGMARHYLLGAEDLALIRMKRRSINRLGFAVQLCLLRYPGLGMGPAEQPPEGMIAFVANQLAVPSAVFVDYAQRDQSRREHAVELQRYLSLRSFGLADWRACLRVGADAAWATDRGEPIVQAMLTHLRANGVLLPTAAVLERIGLAARAGVTRRFVQNRTASQKMGKIKDFRIWVSPHSTGFRRRSWTFPARNPPLTAPPGKGSPLEYDFEQIVW